MKGAICMSFFSILESLLIGPIKLILEIIFETAYRIVDHSGIAIIFLSLAMNILVFPLYRRADTLQEEARDKEAKLHDGVTHIKKVFSGDERMMILRTYYRQNHYKPTDALNGSISLLLEIPFFMAAYQFLSQLDIFGGVSLGPITDLSAPDGLLVIGGVSFNLLPLVMTLINVVSSTLYLKGFPLKTKIQLYGIALFFLVFLYTSPACLVFYWTLNNVFSLVKNIFYRLKNPVKVFCFLSAAIGLALVFFGGVVYETYFYKRKVFIIAIGMLLLLAAFFPMLKKTLHLQKKKREWYFDRKMFLLGNIFLTILIGVLIPSAFISASPQEYVEITYFHHPLWYIVSSLCMAAGMFLVWMRVFYWLASPKGKYFMDHLVWISCGGTLVNYMFFGTDLGVISSSLQYENGVSFSLQQKLINLMVLAATAILLYFCFHRWKRAATNALLISIIALAAMTAKNLITIQRSVDKIPVQQIAEYDDPHFQLSKTGRNVIVLMLDRAMGEYIPYLFQEKPELKEQFAGFTYYENTVSFGGATNFGIPTLFGGYEYTPVEMNKRATEPLAVKHNEALKVMPAIFSENGFDITVYDPTYANYQWIPDLSIYDDYPSVKAYIADSLFSSEAGKLAFIENNHRNFFCLSVMKSMPLLFQTTIYSEGNYYQAAFDRTSLLSTDQLLNSVSTSIGMRTKFLDFYYVLVNMPDMTTITEEKVDTLLLMTNNVTHEPMLLQEPDYTPVIQVDNTLYDAENTDRFVIEGRELKVEQGTQMSHYHTNMAAMLQLGNWFDYLRENDVYDNTRIILVSDHGYALGQLEEFILDDGNGNLNDMERYYPLLMMKDFNSREFVTSDIFMTTADVPTMAMEELITEPVNPFTGKPINSDEKTAHDQFVILSADWDIEINNGNTFLPSLWASVKDNIWDKNNWSFYEGLTVLDGYSAP